MFQNPPAWKKIIWLCTHGSPAKNINKKEHIDFS
jgi:hypothetical protein